MENVFKHLVKHLSESQCLQGMLQSTVWILYAYIWVLFNHIFSVYKRSYILFLLYRFSWEIDNEEGKINDWDPCLGTPNYGSNVTNTISLTAPSTGSEGTYEYTLSCISVQYFGQTENETLKNHVDMNIVVIEENEKGSNITVCKMLYDRIYLGGSLLII